MYKDSSKQSHWSIIIAIAVLIMLPLVNISYKKYKRATEEAHMHKLVRVQNQEADVLVAPGPLPGVRASVIGPSRVVA